MSEMATLSAVIDFFLSLLSRFVWQISDNSNGTSIDANSFLNVDVGGLNTYTT